MNEAIAVSGNNALVLDETEEIRLTDEISAVEQGVALVVIKSEEEYALAAAYAKKIKATEKRVNDYWEPMRKSTYEAYKSVTDHKKEMLDPLQKAEKTLKTKMGDYEMEQERKRREQEEALRRLAQEAINAKLEEAVQAEKNGDAEAVEYAMAEAEMAQDIVNAAPSNPQKMNVGGVSSKKAWVIDNLIPEMVPITVCGVTVHIGDKAAVEKIVTKAINESKGAVKIPGVSYHETYAVQLR